MKVIKVTRDDANSTKVWLVVDHIGAVIGVGSGCTIATIAASFVVKETPAKILALIEQATGVNSGELDGTAKPKRAGEAPRREVPAGTAVRGG